MTNPYLEYYTNQAGSGIAGFQGYRYQRGHGFFGNLFSTILKPLGKYFGKQALSTGMSIGQDMLNGNDFKTSAKKRVKNAGMNVLGDAADRVKLFAQTGKGRRKKRRSRKIKVSNPVIRKKKNTRRKAKPTKKTAKKKRKSKKKRSVTKKRLISKRRMNFNF